MLVTAATNCEVLELNAQDKNRIRDVKEWLSCTLNKDDIQHLVNRMLTKQTTFRSWLTEHSACRRSG
jgi:hypothetical protein